MSRRKHNRTPKPAVAIPTAAEESAPRTWIVAVVLAIAIGVAYGRSVHAPFIFDDQNTIIDNETIRSLWPLIGTNEHPGPLNPAARALTTASRPLVNLSFAFNYYLGALQPTSYHVANMMIHFGTAMLVFAVTKCTLRLPYFAGRYDTSAGWLAFAVAMLWSLHPLQTEAVIYATQRTELMMAFFYLATLYCSMKYWSLLPASTEIGGGNEPLGDLRVRRRRQIWLALAIVACMCGMSSKEVMVSAPLVMLLFERTFIAGSLAAAMRRSWPLYLGLCTTWVLLWILSLGAPHGESAGFGLGVTGVAWWLTQSKVFWMYMKLVVWPWPLLIHYQFPYLTTLADAWMYVVPLVALVLAILILLWRNRPTGFLGVWVFAILSPTFFVPIITEMAAERRMYLPLAAIVVLFVVGGYWLISSVVRRWGFDRQMFAGMRWQSALSAIAAAVVCLALAVFTAQRAAAYDDTLALWQEVVRFQPDDFMARDNLGLMLTRADRLPEAIQELNAALALKPNYFNSHNNLGAVYSRLGQYSKAAKSFQDALAIEPEHPLALNNLGTALMRLGQLPEAIEQFGHALRLQPGSAEAHNNLGNALTRVGRLPEAIRELRESLTLNPDDPFTLNNLGNALMLSGDYSEAVEQLELAVRLKPDHADFYNNAGLAQSHCDRMPLAIERFRRAIELNPSYADAHYNLAVALLRTNQTEKAIPHLMRVVDNPKFLQAYPALIRALAAANR